MKKYVDAAKKLRRSFYRNWICAHIPMDIVYSSPEEKRKPFADYIAYCPECGYTLRGTIEIEPLELGLTPEQIRKEIWG